MTYLCKYSAAVVHLAPPPLSTENTSAMFSIVFKAPDRIQTLTTCVKGLNPHNQINYSNVLFPTAEEADFMAGCPEVCKITLPHLYTESDKNMVKMCEVLTCIHYNYFIKLFFIDFSFL